MFDITNLTSNEINAIIFKDARVDEPRAMPVWIAEQVVTMEHVDHHLRDWAFTTMEPVWFGDQ